ncbi:hypothetical protein [Microcoleus sp. BROC3]|uniref:hypothetical protein n=1 Tax=Microcoleus sp. BROC3 TaxID=3055323 RepID=UPI002FD5749D
MAGFIIVVFPKYLLDILLIFQPACCPEVNPLERIWGQIKEELSWTIYEILDELKEKVGAFIRKFSTE